MAWLHRIGLKRCPGTMMACHVSQDLHLVHVPRGLTIESAQAFPDNCYMHAHVNASHVLDGFRVVTVFRDPRDVLVSYCRYRRNIDGIDLKIIDAINDFWGAPFVETYRGFLGWRGRSIIVRYEDLPVSVIGDGIGLYDYADRDWNTRTGAPSRWQDAWTEEIERAWKLHSGPDLLAQAGYV